MNLFLYKTASVARNIRPAAGRFPEAGVKAKYKCHNQVHEQADPLADAYNSSRDDREQV